MWIGSITIEGIFGVKHGRHVVFATVMYNEYNIIYPSLRRTLYCDVTFIGRHGWRYYLASFLVVITLVVATYVTVMYSLTYGYSASVQWTVSFFLTFSHNLLILQPLKVSLVAAVISVFFGSRVGPATPADYYVKWGKVSLCEYVIL